MKFLHAADIHLDSPMAGLHARTDLPPDLIRHSTRRAFGAMIDLALREDVAFVVIAGDLYDGEWKDFGTGHFFATEMRRLGRPCFVLRGNHDAASVLTRDLPLPPNVRDFSTRRCQTHDLPELGVALHGHSFANRAVPEDLSGGYCDPTPHRLNIGVLHTSGEEPGDHDTYAPCSPAALRLKGYGYWALGHIHTRRVLHDGPWIVYPGNIQGRHARETGPKGCTLVTVEDRCVVAVEHRPIDVLRWAMLEVDATEADAAMLEQRLAEEVHDAVGGAEGRPLLARLALRGATALHGSLANDRERLAAICRNAAIEAGGELWIEKLRLRTQPLHAAQSDSLGPLRDAFLGSLADPALRARLLADLAKLHGKIPHPGRAELDLPMDDAGLERLAEEAWAIAAAALAAEARP